MAPFNLPQIKAITDHDDMDLYTLGEKKCALYAVIPDNDNTFNFLVSLLYSQAFQALYYSADQIHHGALPHHVHFVLDEFAAMPLPLREIRLAYRANSACHTVIIFSHSIYSSANSDSTREGLQIYPISICPRSVMGTLTKERRRSSCVR